MGNKDVLVVGTGTIGEPLIGLLCDFKDQLDINDVYFYKRTPLLDEVPKVNSLLKRGAKLLVIDDAVGQTFETIGNEVSGVFTDHLPDMHVVLDCTPAGNENKETYYYDCAYKDGLATKSPLFIAQGSEKGFGVPYAYGINDEVLLDPRNDKFVQVVSCNTHNIARLIEVFSDLGDICHGDFVCMRRSNDVSQDGGFVPSMTVGTHKDEGCGTHHARDVRDLYKTIDKDIATYSSALKISTQYMHAIRFSIELEGSVTADEALDALAADRFVALTYKTSSNKVFSFGRDHGYYGRIFSQTVVPRGSLQVYNSHPGKTTIVGFCFTPQDGNSLLTSLAAVASRTLGDGYESRLDFVNELLFGNV